MCCAIAREFYHTSLRCEHSFDAKTPVELHIHVIKIESGICSRSQNALPAIRIVIKLTGPEFHGDAEENMDNARARIDRFFFFCVICISARELCFRVSLDANIGWSARVPPAIRGTVPEVNSLK